ncbi:MAG: xanthine dehydrogenase family protein subunit M [Desulfobacterales bacterium]
MLPPFSYVRPDKLKDAVKYLSEQRTAVHAGGTDLLGCLRDGIMSVDKVVSISALKELHGIRETEDGGIIIGAMTTITEVSEHPAIRTKYPGLAAGASEVASPQLRNQGTLGGNLCQKPRCWYYRGEFDCLRKGGQKCFAISGENQFHAIFGHEDICIITHPSDTAPVLAALNAHVHATGSKGERTIPVSDLFVLPSENVMKETLLEPDEIITHIQLPPPSSNLRSSYRKVRARRAWDFALAGVALALEMDGGRVIKGRVVLSGAAPIPWRSRPVEDVIFGKQLDDKTIADAAQAAVKGAEPVSENAYKLHLFRGVIEEELAAIRDK